MPEKEFDPEDPMELVGVELPADEKSDRKMSTCLIEEYLWLGWSREEILEIFKSPFYTGPHRIWLHKGEAFIQDVMNEVLRKWRA